MADNNHASAVALHLDINDNVAVSGGSASGQANPPIPGHVAHTVTKGIAVVVMEADTQLPQIATTLT